MMIIKMGIGGLLLAVHVMVQAATSPQPSEPNNYRAWIEQMRAADRGPFEKVAWFCNDGAILPPQPYACLEHGGGRQHGVWSERTKTLRANGYYIANVLAALPPEEALANHAEQIKWVLVERFLLEHDDGWILRKARHYRGAFQSEGEAAAARQLLEALLAEPRYRTTHYLLTREAARLLPWRVERQSLDTARNLATKLAERDKEFTQLRNKIHGYPERSDLEKIRSYREQRATPATVEPLKALETALAETFEHPDLLPALKKLAGQVQADARVNAAALNKLADRLGAAADSAERLAVLGDLLAHLRDGLADWSKASALRALDLSLAAEQAAVAAGLDWLEQAGSLPRGVHLQRLRDNLDVLYGLGFVTARERDAQRAIIAELGNEPTLGDYRDGLDTLALVPAWADGWLHYHFKPVLDPFALIEPRVALFTQDRLRGSPLLFHSRVLDGLTREADALAGVQHEIMGQTVGLGLRALNAGLARGPLQPLEAAEAPEATARRPIILTPETVADLPPVAGILTARAGNDLSHVQLLARNLGIPNVVIGSEQLPVIEDLMGRDMVLLVSPGGIVRLVADGPQWDDVFPKQEEKPATIRVDLDKLDLAQQSLLSLDDLRASDSGRVVGPKAAKLGELKTHFPERVSAGLAIPFGTFRRMLESIAVPGYTSLYEWMRQEYRRLDGLENDTARETATRHFLAEVRARIQGMTLPADFRDQLRQRMREVFGDDGSYGVFVRSDTNVEDLPGFTGAGLNLTVPNVVGFEAVLNAIKDVWASPFTERAFGWRQSLMTQPEHVYASVLLHKTVPADKSGVMVTADISNNNPGIYTIATNEGIGGGVEGQAAESLKVNPDTGEVTLLASATESRKTALPASGGVSRAWASGTPRILEPDEIDQLIDFGQSLPERYPILIDDDGQAVPADVEFAFVDGQLYLIQIRPFLQSQRAQRNRLLQEMDEQLEQTRDIRIDLSKSVSEAP